MGTQHNWGGRREGAGRPSGSKNRRTEATESILARLDCDPIEGMALIATNNREALGITEDVPIALRARMYEALAPYIAPRLRTSEVTLHEGEQAQNGSLDVTKKFIENLLTAK
jgi:hypothetical protein